MTEKLAKELCTLLNKSLKLKGEFKFKPQKMPLSEYVIHSRQLLFCLGRLREITEAMSETNFVWTWYVVADKCKDGCGGCIDIYIKEGI